MFSPFFLFIPIIMSIFAKVFCALAHTHSTFCRQKMDILMPEQKGKF